MAGIPPVLRLLGCTSSPVHLSHYCEDSPHLSVCTPVCLSVHLSVCVFSCLPQDCEFQVGMKLEAVDKKNPGLVCVASVADVIDDHFLVHFDNWDDTYDYW